MKLNKVLVLYKHTVEDNPIHGRQGIHEASIQKVKDVLAGCNINFALHERGTESKYADSDLIITLGGDGTLLSTVNLAGGTPVIGVNSTPGYSAGFFCACYASNFESVLSKIIGDKIGYLSLPLLEAAVDSQIVPHLALNDILFAGSTPAETVRYEINIGKQGERQRSSGIWIAAGPGSTAAIKSAGGKKQEITSEVLQYLVREPYSPDGKRYKLKTSFLKSDEEIVITSETNGSAIYLDGTAWTKQVNRQSRVTVKIAQRSFRIFLNVLRASAPSQ